MVNLDIAKILNKKNVLNLIDGQISLIRKNRYCAWSGEKSFKDKIDKKLLDGKSGLYTLSYQKTLLDVPKLVYLGQSNSIGGRGHHGGYGLILPRNNNGNTNGKSSQSSQVLPQKSPV
jgi:hypothetical protein